MKTHIGSTATLLMLAVTGCASSSGSVDSTEVVCDEFAAYARDGQPADQRSDVVSSIGDVIDNADPGVQGSYGGLTSSVDAPESSWTLAADTFAQACFDAGWES